MLRDFSAAGPTALRRDRVLGRPLRQPPANPVANLLMKPDAAPASAFVDLSGTALTVDGTLGQATGWLRQAGRRRWDHLLQARFRHLPAGEVDQSGVEQRRAPGLGFSPERARHLPTTHLARARRTSRTGRSTSCACRAIRPASHHRPCGTMWNSLRPTTRGAAERGRASASPCLPEGGIPDSSGKNHQQVLRLEEYSGDVNSPMNWASNRIVFVAHNSPDDVRGSGFGCHCGRRSRGSASS